MALVLLSGTSGSSKKFIRNRLCHNFGYLRLVTMTTRHKIFYETSADYTFVENNTFDLLAEKGVFLETTVHESNKYGVTLAEVLNSAKTNANSVLIVTPDGADKIVKYLKANCIPYVAVFVADTAKLSISRLADGLLDNSLSKDAFVSKVESLAYEQSKWLEKAQKGITFDMIVELSVDEKGSATEINETANVINAHVRRINAVESSKSSAFKSKLA